MWTVAVVVGGVLVQNGCQVTFTGDEHPVGAFAADGADPALSVRVRAGRPRRGVEHVDALAGEHRIERGGEFVVAVAEQEPQPGRASVEVHQQIPCLLGDPGTGRVGGDPGDVDLARADLDEEQHVDPFKEHGVDGEEVAGQDRVRQRGGGYSTPCWPLPGSPGRPAHREFVDAPTTGSRQPTAAPARGSAWRPAGGRVWRVDTSNAGRSAPGASAAGSPG